MKRLLSAFLAALLLFAGAPALSTGVAPAVPRLQFVDSSGNPLAAGSVTVYLAGTTTSTNTWQDAGLTTLNTNPVTLDGSGAATIWLSPSVAYKFLVKNAAGSTIATIDNISGGLTSVSGVSIPNSGSGAYNVLFAVNDTMTANRTLTLDLNDYPREINLLGDLTLGASLTTSGAYNLTLTTTGVSNVTLPTTGTLATLAGAEALSNKTVTSSTISGGTLTGTITASSPTLTGSLTVTNTVTAGTVTTTALTVNGAAYSTPGWVLLETKTASTSASLTFTTSITSTYDEYIFEIVDLLPATDGTQIYIRTSADSGSTWDSGASDYTYVVATQAGGVATSLSSAGATQIILAEQISNTTARGGVVGHVRLYNPKGTASHKRFVYQVANPQNGTTASIVSVGQGARAATAAISGVQFLSSSGNLTSGTIRLYGVKKS